MYYTNGGDTWTDKSNWLNNLSHCDWNNIISDSISHVIDESVVGNNLSSSMTSLSGLSSISRMTFDLNRLTGPIPSAVCNKVTGGSLYLQGDDFMCNNDSSMSPVFCNTSKEDSVFWMLLFLLLVVWTVHL